MRKVAVIILNWNNWEMTKECVESLSDQTHTDFDTFVIDNGSSNDSFQQLKNQFVGQPKVLLHSSPTNLGFPAGCNLGVELAKKNDEYDYFLFLNNDSTADPSLIEKLHVLHTEAGASMVCGKGMNAKTGEVYFKGWRLPNFFWGDYKNYDLDSKLNAWPTDFCEGSSLFVSSEFIEKCIADRGYFMDESLFMYCDDLDLGIYCIQKKLKMYVSNEIGIRHHISASAGGQGNPLAYYYITRNRPKLARALMGPIKGTLYDLFYITSRFPLGLRALLKSRQLANAVFAGTADAYLGRDGKWKHHQN